MNTSVLQDSKSPSQQASEMTQIDLDAYNPDQDSDDEPIPDLEWAQLTPCFFTPHVS